MPSNVVVINISILQLCQNVFTLIISQHLSLSQHGKQPFVVPYSNKHLGQLVGDKLIRLRDFLNASFIQI